MMEKEALLEDLGGTLASIERAVRDPGEREHRSYREGGWTLREIMAHLADCELVNLWRFCRAVTVDGGPVVTFDENRWALDLRYAERPLDESLGLFRGARRTLVQHVRGLPQEVLEGRAALHPEKGRMTPLQWAELMVGHGRHHLGQLEAIRSGDSWTPVVTPDSWKYTGGAPPA